MDNMWATLIIMGFTMLFIFLAAIVYVVLTPKSKLFWAVMILFGILWSIGVFELTGWCTDMGWITPCGDMCNVTMC